MVDRGDVRWANVALRAALTDPWSRRLGHVRDLRHPPHGHPLRKPPRPRPGAAFDPGRGPRPSAHTQRELHRTPHSLERALERSRERREEGLNRSTIGRGRPEPQRQDRGSYTRNATNDTI